MIYSNILLNSSKRRQIKIMEENERREELNKKRLENLKLENLEVKLTSEDIELLNLIAGNKGTPKGVLRNMLREHLRN